MITRNKFNLAFYATKGAYSLDAGGGLLSHLKYEFVDNGVWAIEETGLKAALYSNGQGHYVLSFAGTDNAQDWYQNISSMGYDQWDRSRDLITNRIENVLDLESNISSIVITGHSLGGALAQYAAYDLVSDGVLTADQIDLVTFNSLGGVSGLKDKHGANYTDDLLENADIYHYYQPSDLVVQLSQHLGGQESNYKLTSSTNAEFFLDAHSLDTIEEQINSGSVLIDSQASHNYFNLEEILPLVQALSSGTNGLLGGSDQEATEMEAIARLFTVLPGITLIETFPLKPDNYTEVRDWILDNVAETVLGVSDPSDREVTVFGLGVALGAMSTGLNYTRLPLFIEATSQLTASYLEYLNAHNDSPDATTPAKDALTFSLFSILSGGSLNEQGVLEGGRISRVEVNHILEQSASHEAHRYSELLQAVADILGEDLEDSLKGYIDFHHTLLSKGIHFSTVADAKGLSSEQLQSWLDQSGHFDLNGRLVRYSVMNNLPFILMGPESTSYVVSEIKSSDRYAKDSYSEHFWADRLKFYRLALSQNQENLPYGKGLENEHALFQDLKTGDIVKNYLFADTVNKYVFGTDQDDTSGLEGGAYHDHLYGMEGNDELFGRDGNDTLEGNDHDDHLTGGKGRDYLLGGAGNDTYHFSSGDGYDRILDTDGINSIIIDGKKITSLRRVAGQDDVYKNDSDENDTRKYIRTSSGFRIVSENGSDIIEVGGYSDFSRFDISVNDAANSVSPEPGDTIISHGFRVDDPEGGPFIGTWNPKWGKSSYSDYQGAIFYEAMYFDRTIGVPVNWEFWGYRGNDQLIGWTEDDTLYGHDGDDYITGAGGADSLFGNNGKDLISGGTGSDLIIGGRGSDTISGHIGHDFIFGNGPYVTVDPSNGEILWEAVSEEGDVDIISGGAGNDWISSGMYVDMLSGDAGEDQIFGAEGDDIIDGGADDDFIMGDSAGNRFRYTEGVVNKTHHIFTGVDHVDKRDGSLSYNDTIYGDSGNDTLIGEIGDDSIFGGAGHDYIEGDKLNDSSRYGGDNGQYAFYSAPNGLDREITADDFVDFQVEWSGNDTLDGGAGQDTIFGNAGNDTIYGGDDHDTLYGDDHLLAETDHGNDTIYGGNGSDEIRGQGGDDVLYGDSGIDQIYGGTGDDQLDGGSDQDLLYGEEGDDRLAGGAGYDFLWGGEGNDTLSAGANGGELKGESGNDTYVVKPGDGVVFIDDSIGINTIRFEGGIGASDIDAYTTHFNPNSNQFIRIQYGTSENDVIAMSQSTYARIAGVQFSDGSSSPLILQNPNGTEVGSDGDDVMEGAIGANHYYGLEGDDSIDAGAGNDFVYGGEGNDIIIGGEGEDHLYGGNGNDTFLYSLGDGLDFISAYDSTEGRQDILSFGEGISAEATLVTKSGEDLILVLSNNDKVTVERFFKENDTDHELTEIEFSDGTTWNSETVDSLLQSNTPFDDELVTPTEGGVLSGGEGSDRLTGQEGNDQLSGDAGDDVLLGNGGDDILMGGLGDDTLSGGQGTNIYHYRLGDGNDDLVIDALNSSDTLLMSAEINPAELSLSIERNDLLITLPGNSDIITVSDFFNTNASDRTSLTIQFASDASTWIDTDIRAQVFSASEGDDYILGTSASEVIDGLAGNDQIYGFEGDDSLQGGQGNDEIFGGQGDDTLEGGDGNDRLYGGAGNDAFLFGLGSGNDVIAFEAFESQDVTNTLRLTGGLNAEDLTFTRIPDSYNSGRDHLLIEIEASGETLTVERYFSNLSDDTTSTAQIQIVEFADGTQWNEADIFAALTNTITNQDDYLVAGGGDDVIEALAGDDRVVGGAGNDQIRGGTGNDLIYGYAGDDQIVGDEGGDWIYGGAGNDHLNGGLGNDYLHTGSGDDTVKVNIGEGQDIVEFDGGYNTIKFEGDIEPSDLEFRKQGYSLYISAADPLAWSVEINKHFFQPLNHSDGFKLDRLLVNDQETDFSRMSGLVLSVDETPLPQHGGVVRTQSNGLETWTLVQGAAGNDLLFGNDDLHKFDQLEGGLGNDRLYGGANNDILKGEEGNDFLDGGADNDQLFGGEGQDILVASLGNDRLYGDAGDDIFRVSAESGSTTILDKAADFNVIELGEGLQVQDAQLLENAGDLLIVFSQGTNVLVKDYFDSDNSDGVVDEIRFADGTIWDVAYIASQAGTLPLFYDGVNTPAGFNVVTDRNGQGQLIGTSGSDFIAGIGSQDVIHGGDGRDIIVGNGGSDELVGGRQDDLIIGDGKLFGGEGNDILVSQNMSNDNYDGRAFMFGGNGDDTYRVGASSVDTFIYNGSEASHLQGSFYASGAGGSSGDYDVLEFTDGISPDDVNILARNGDSLELEIGRNGHLVTLVDYYGPTTYQGQGIGGVAPIDEIRFEDGTIWDQGHIAEAHAQYSDPIGPSGDDELFGTSQDDVIYGGAGWDLIEGFEGNDELYGETGSDILVGGEGNDLLNGGQGDNYYDFYPGFGQDTIVESGNGFSEIWFYELGESDISYAKSQNDLLITVKGTTDQITVKDWYKSSEHQLYINFEDYGVFHSTEHINSIALELAGPENALPFASDDSISTQEDQSVSIDVLANDSDVDGHDLVIDAASAQNGKVEINQDGTLSYTPNLNYAGEDTIVYQVSDGQGGSASASVQVTVISENDIPIAIADSATTQEDQSITIDVLSNDSDVDGDSLVLSDVSAIHGSVVVNEDSTLTYTSASDFNGIDTISYEVSDNNGGTVNSYVALIVNPENDQPIALSDSASTQVGEMIRVDVLANDTDIDGDSLEINFVSAENGAAFVNEDKTISYIPNVAFTGFDSITYQVSDGNGGLATANLVIRVVEDNATPIANPDIATTLEDTSIFINVLANDVVANRDDLIVTNASAQNGLVSVDDQGIISYSPEANFNGVDTISYEISDGDGGLASSMVTVTVNSENDLPVAISDSAITDQDVPVVIDVLINDVDIDGDSLSISAAAASNGSVLINEDGTLSYTPMPGFFGEDTISYEVSDGNAGKAEAIVMISVNEVVDEPINLVGSNSSETLEGGNNDDNLAAKGGKDSLFGHQGNDILNGGGGNDLLYGGSGNDTLKGGNGADDLYGNQGNDLLVGGKGSDTYHFESGDNYDLINNASNNYLSDNDVLIFDDLKGVEDIWFTQTNNHLDIYVLGTDDHVRVNNWYREDKFQLDSVEAAGQTIDTINIEQLVSAMAAFGEPSEGSISLNSEERAQVDTAIAVAWA